MSAKSSDPACLQSLRELAYPYYLCALLVHEDFRAPVTAMLALDAELRAIPRKVTEEMIAHIRFAWWKEGLDALIAGQQARAHPVLQALAGQAVPLPLLRRAVDKVQEQYPTYLTSPLPETLQACEQYIREKAQKGLARWRRTLAVVQAHEARFHAGWRPWLALKLLFVR